MEILDLKDQIRKLSVSDEDTFTKAALLEELNHTREKTSLFQDAYNKISTENKKLHRTIVDLNKQTSQQQLIKHRILKQEFIPAIKEGTKTVKWNEILLKKTIEDLSTENTDVFAQLKRLSHRPEIEKASNDSSHTQSIQQELESSKEEVRLFAFFHEPDVQMQVLFLRRQHQRAKASLKQLEMESVSIQERLKNELTDARNTVLNLSNELDALKGTQQEKENKNFFHCLHNLIAKQEIQNIDSEHHLMLKQVSYSASLDNNLCGYLLQIDIVKELRLEMEDMKHHYHALENELQITKQRASVLQDELDQRDHIERSFHARPPSQAISTTPFSLTLRSRKVILWTYSSTK